MAINKTVVLSNYVELPLKSLVKANWNYKNDNDEVKEKLKNNIMRNGQLENIIVRELNTGFYEVVNGNHRYEVLKELNVSNVVCYNLGKISEKQAIRIAIETNETRFEADNIKLAEKIQELLEEYDFSDLECTMPYNEDDLKAFEKLLEFDWDNYSCHGEIEDDSSKDIEIELLFSPEEYERWNNIKSTLDKNDKDTLIYLIDQFYPTIAHNSPIGS